MAAEHPIPPASEEKTTFRQSPMLQFFLAKDTSKHDDPRGRVRTVPMKVLCLGLPRSATESLAKALEILGKSTYHDKSYTTSVLIRITLSSHERSSRYRAVEKAAHARLWHEALHAKHHNPDGDPWGRKEFDQLLGSCSAVTDAPCAFFAEDLIRAYPEAKVILNKREFGPWHKSVVANMQQVLSSWFFAVFMRLDGELIWIYRLWFELFGIWFDGDIRANGRKTYDAHYALVRGAMAGREEGKFLEWEVQDGWEPLCAFLGVDVPGGMEFPSGNTSREFDGRIHGSMAARFRRAGRNLIVILGLGVFGVLWVGGAVAPLGWRERVVESWH